MKYTKGEWRIEESISYDFIRVGKKRIAMIDNLEDSAIKEHKANAKLIAAAPELLEALKEIAEGKGCFDMDRLIHANNTIENMRNIAKEAIKKAE